MYSGRSTHLNHWSFPANRMWSTTFTSFTDPLFTLFSVLHGSNIKNCTRLSLILIFHRHTCTFTDDNYINTRYVWGSTHLISFKKNRYNCNGFSQIYFRHKRDVFKKHMIHVIYYKTCSFSLHIFRGVLGVYWVGWGGGKRPGRKRELED